MKIKAREGGDVVEISDEGAQLLIDAGIYDAVVEPGDKESPRVAAPAQKKPAPDKSRTVAPLMTEDTPALIKKGK